MPTPFTNATPDNCLHDPERDLWAVEPSNGALPGSTAFTCKPDGAMAEHGQGTATIEGRKTVHALDAAVGIHFAGPAVRCLRPGHAGNGWPHPQREKSLAAWLAPGDTLPPDANPTCATRSLDPAWHTLVY